MIGLSEFCKKTSRGIMRATPTPRQMQRLLCLLMRGGGSCWPPVGAAGKDPRSGGGAQWTDLQTRGCLPLAACSRQSGRAQSPFMHLNSGCCGARADPSRSPLSAVQRRPASPCLCPCGQQVPLLGSWKALGGLGVTPGAARRASSLQADQSTPRSRGQGQLPSRLCSACSVLAPTSLPTPFPRLSWGVFPESHSCPGHAVSGSASGKPDLFIEVHFTGHYFFCCFF